MLYGSSSEDDASVYQVVGNGVKRQSGEGVNLQFPGDVAAMGNDGVYGDAETVGNFLVRQSLHKADDDFAFAVGNSFAAFGIVDDLRYPRRSILRLYTLFEQSDGWYKNDVLHLAVVVEPFLDVVDIEECGGKLVVAQPILRKVLDDDVLKFLKLCRGAAMMF